ncbi:MAG TPA: hypothetical protein VGB85_10305 [Nannocystis sp.]|jgi:hypothetical protein
MHLAPPSGRHAALATLLICACPALTLDPIVTDGTTGTPPDPATGQVTDGDGTTTAPAITDTSPSTGTPETATGLMPETTTGLATTATTSEAGETTGTTGTDETTGTTGPSGCLGDIVGNPACGGVTPYCVDGACVSCTELDCIAAEPDKPICAQDLGTCVQCQQNADCAADPPICNQATGTCVQCTEHEQCPATACNLETGLCFPEGPVLYVDNSPDAPTFCSDLKPDQGLSPEKPLCTLQNALGRVVEGQPTTIKIKTGTKPQNGIAELPIGSYTVAMRHYGNTVPSLIISFADPALTINEGNLVFMHRIAVWNTSPSSDPLIACAGGELGARLWLDQQSIFGGRTAIRANNCRVHVRRSTITGNTIGGIDLAGPDGDLAKLWVENSYITDNNGTKFAAIRMGDVTSADILFSTIALNKSPLAAIECIGNWSGQLTIRNSAIVNPGPLYGPACDANVTTSFQLPDSPDKAGLMSVFSTFADGVFRAKLDGELKDIAVWHIGDPIIDHDGDPRPTVDSSPDYAGADRPSR